MNKPTQTLEKLRAQKLKESVARTALMEQQRATRARDLIPAAEVDDEIRRALMPVRQRFLALPAEVAHLVNPTDPAFARDALKRLRDDALRMIRSEVAAE